MLAKLYGTPAPDAVTARLELSPTAFSLQNFKRLLSSTAVDETKERHDQTIDLGETKTDAGGQRNSTCISNASPTQPTPCV